MAFFVVEGKGVVKNVVTIKGKVYAEVPKEWNCNFVRMYMLREVKVGQK